MVRVKICGITTLRDAQAAVDAGADALGFIFAQSPRRVSRTKVKWIVTHLAPWITKVGVFVNENIPNIVETMEFCKLDAVQLHGDEDVSTVRALRAMGYPVIKAIRVAGSLHEKKLDRYPASAILLDTAAPGLYGGSGRVFDWKVLKKVSGVKPVIVSGGLKPDNVRALLKVFKPYGVDVSSGVESSPRKKNYKSVKEFIKNVKTR